jgi:adenylyltransferase/sulfurtransferase
MLTAEDQERYLRHILLKEVGAQGQQTLLRSRALIVGAGGLGAPLIQYLAAAGVGTLGIADDDRIELSNLQRQVIFRADDVGASKTERAAAAARRINPGVCAHAHGKIAEESARALVREYDIVVEGVDSFAARHALNRACIAERRTLVSAALGRFDGQIAVFKPHAGADLPCYRCLVPEAPPREAQLRCVEEGVLGPVAGVVGALAAVETLKELLGLQPSLAGRLLVYRALEGQLRAVALPRDPQCPDCGPLS